MQVFLSYASCNVDLAKRIAYSLRDDGDDVFFDRESLPLGETYDARIREAIQGSEVFVFLISPDAIASGSYALAELGMAERASAEGKPRILPVMVLPTDFAAMPAYLRSRTILQPNGDILAETLAAVAEIRRDTKRDQVAVSVMVSNSGWTLTFHLMEPHPREIFYRFADETGFTSTGFTQFPDFTTGHRLPRTYVTVPAFTGTRDLFIKYVDSRGRERGPYPLVIDAVQSLTAFTKEVLETTKPWVAFREYPEGRMLVYFTHLLAYKDALREIRYSVDDTSLSKSIRFGGTDDDEAIVEIPLTTRYVCVQLTFIDGTQYPPERFNMLIAERN
jgi:hypothetical protein